VLHGTTNEPQAVTTSATTAPPPAIINTDVDIWAQAIAKAFSNQNAPRAQGPAYPQIQTPPQQQQGNCPPQNTPREVDEYIAQDKIRRDLQSRNPNQPDAAQLVYGVCQDRASVQNHSPRATTNIYAISLDERLTAMEREMYDIRRTLNAGPLPARHRGVPPACQRGSAARAVRRSTDKYPSYQRPDPASLSASPAPLCRPSSSHRPVKAARARIRPGKDRQQGCQCIPPSACQLSRYSILFTPSLALYAFDRRANR